MNIYTFSSLYSPQSQHRTGSSFYRYTYFLWRNFPLNFLNVRTELNVFRDMLLLDTYYFYVNLFVRI